MTQSHAHNMYITSMDGRGWGRGLENAQTVSQLKKKNLSVRPVDKHLTWRNLNFHESDNLLAVGQILPPRVFPERTKTLWTLRVLPIR